MRRSSRPAQLRPQIKWANDLLFQKRKICGILTELSVEAESRPGAVRRGRHRHELQSAAGGFPPGAAENRHLSVHGPGPHGKPQPVAAAQIASLCNLAQHLPDDGQWPWLEQYTHDCITIGKDVRIIQGAQARVGARRWPE